MAYLSRWLVVLGALMPGVAAAQQYDENGYPVQDPYYQQQQQQQDPYYQQQQQDPYYQQQAATGDPYAQQPQQYEYAFMGSHPQPYDYGGGYCYQTTAHYHPYAPFDQYLFRESGGYWYFVGDPADFGYSQQMWGYNGNHPIPASWGGGYCYINWAHRHPYSPPSSVYFNFVGGYYVYSGPWDPLYWRWRDRYYGYYGNYYRSNYYGGRYFTVRPPHVHRPSFSVGAPGVRVVVSPPGGRGGVVVGAPPGRGGVVVTPPGVHVTPPAPRVYAPAPPPVRMAPPAPRVYAPPAVHVAPPAPRVYAPPPVRVAPPPVHRPAPAPMRIAPPPPRHR